MDSLSANPSLIVGIIVSYFIVLFFVSRFTARGEDTNTQFFTADKSSPWILVAIGMIGASLSGVTFISIPGLVGKAGANTGFSYMQMVFGYLLGYLVIATVLMPIYYRYNLTSIYGFLEKRLGFYAYKTGAGYFLLSRLLGASLRLYLVAIVLDKFVLSQFGIPFFLTVLITIILIWIYTSKGGIKTIVVTDVFQTVTMLLAVILTIIAIANALDIKTTDIISYIKQTGNARIWHFEGGWSDPNNFYKQFISGALIAIVMTGLDQDMMQKNLTCRSLKDAQKNMFTFSIVLIFANLLFLGLGALLYAYANNIGLTIPKQADYLYPTIALGHLSPFVGIVFVLGLIAAAYSSADSALTSLTTSFCVDFLDLETKDRSDALKKKIRRNVHILMSIIIFLMIILVKQLNDDSVVNTLFKVAGYTYGPLMGLFGFSILTKYKVKGKWVVLVCLAAPILSFILDTNSKELFNGFEFGYLNIALNGLLTFCGLGLIKRIK